MKQIHFYAVADDLLPVLEAVEQVKPIKYSKTGHYETSKVESLTSSAVIPNLGKASSEAAIGCTSYLVSDLKTEIKSDPFVMKTGARMFSIDQLLNQDTVLLTPAGEWSDDIVLYGRVATVSNSPPAQELMKLFRSALKKNFKKVKAYYIGPKALSLFQSGYRLTISAQSPPEFDLKQ
jgi:hypothetical protein